MKNSRITITLLFTILAPGCSYDCLLSKVEAPVPFTGSRGEVLRLSDQSLWQVDDIFAYVGKELSPDVEICKNREILVVGDKGKGLYVDNMQGCREERVISPVPFKSQHREIIELSDHSRWEVLFAYEYIEIPGKPPAIICPETGKMIVNWKHPLDVVEIK